MAANTDAMLRAAVRAMKTGKNDEAQKLLMKIIEYKSADNRAWLLLFDVMESHDDKQICLENALYTDPDNSAIQKKLQAFVQGKNIPPMDLDKFTDDVQIDQEKFSQSFADAFDDSGDDAFGDDAFGDDAFDEDAFVDAFDDAFSDDAFGGDAFGDDAFEKSSPFTAPKELEVPEKTPFASPATPIEPEKTKIRPKSPTGGDSLVKTDSRKQQSTKKKKKDFGPPPDMDHDQLFDAIPVDIEPTRIPGESEHYPSMVVPAITVLIILNIMTVIWLYVNSSWCSYMQCWAG